MGYRIKSTPGRQVSGGQQQQFCDGKRHVDGDDVVAQQRHVSGYKSDGSKDNIKKGKNDAIGNGGGMHGKRENGASGQHVKRHDDCDSNEGQSQKKEFKVMLTVYKRLRNAKKRLRGIDEIRDKAAAGKTLNADQVGFLCLFDKKLLHI